LNPYLLEVVNLPNNAARFTEGRLPDQPQSAELVRMAVGRISLAVPIYKDQHRCLPSALVIGGGVAGMSRSAIADSAEVHWSSALRCWVESA
jgi:heterodisulfide reductase subunit A-like polyferredoxin